MNKRDIFLDFTSLLDVTLIVIFFFVIFSHLDSEENKNATEQKLDEMQQAIAEAESKEFEANELIEQLENEIDMVRDSDENEAEILEEMIEYSRSANIKIIVSVNDDGWSARVSYKEEVVAVLDEDSDIEAEITKILDDAGYDENSTIFCDFIYDGSVPKTNKAYRRITKAIDNLTKDYENLFCSKTDLSIGKEE